MEHNAEKHKHGPFVCHNYRISLSKAEAIVAHKRSYYM